MESKIIDDLIGGLFYKTHGLMSILSIEFFGFQPQAMIHFENVKLWNKMIHGLVQSWIRLIRY